MTKARMRTMRVCGSRGRWVLWALVAVTLLQASASLAQFRNQGMQLPSVGWLGMGTTTDGINRAFGKTWGATDQFTLGVGYFRAMGYNLWWDNQTAMGFGGAIQTGDPKTIVSLNASTGLRYNFLDERHRPFVAGHIQYVQIFNAEGTSVQGNDALGGQPLWVGPRLGGGYEWVFGEEMSLQAEVSGVVLLNLDTPPKFTALARLSYNVYF